MHKTPANIWWREQIYAFPSNFSHFEQQQIARVLTALSERAPLCISRIYRCEFYVAPPLWMNISIYLDFLLRCLWRWEREGGERNISSHGWIAKLLISLQFFLIRHTPPLSINALPDSLLLSFFLFDPPPLSLVSPRSTSLSLCPSLSRSLAGYPALRSIPTQFIPKYNTVSIRSIY